MVLDAHTDMYICMYVCVCTYVCMYNIYIYIYIYDMQPAVCRNLITDKAHPICTNTHMYVSQ